MTDLASASARGVVAALRETLICAALGATPVFVHALWMVVWDAHFAQALAVAPPDAASQVLAAAVMGVTFYGPFAVAALTSLAVGYRVFFGDADE